MNNVSKILGISLLAVGLLTGCQGQSDEPQAEGKPKAEDVEKPVYDFKDVESMRKAESFEEAFDKIFGHDRHFVLVHKELSKSIMGPRGGRIEGTKVFKQSGVNLYIKMKKGVDTRVEMIDYLHYVKYSGLLDAERTRKELKSNADWFYITMKVYPPTKPGMNVPEPHQTWQIKTDQVRKIPFKGNKKSILSSISKYGHFEGVNPTVQ